MVRSKEKMLKKIGRPDDQIGIGISLKKSYDKKIEKEKMEKTSMKKKEKK